MKSNNLGTRIRSLESSVKSLGREKIVVFATVTEKAFDKLCEEYRKTHPEPEMFIRIVKFSKPPEDLNTLRIINGVNKF